MNLQQIKWIVKSFQWMKLECERCKGSGTKHQNKWLQWMRNELQWKTKWMQLKWINETNEWNEFTYCLNYSLCGWMN